MELGKDNSPRPTEQEIKEFCTIVSLGCSQETACKYLGWSGARFRHELINNPVFSEKLRRAEASPEINHMRNVRNAAQDEKHWRSSVWWLERCAPQRYARRSPDVITAEQFQQAIEHLADTIVDEIQDVELRKKLLTRFSEIAALFPTESDDSNLNDDGSEESI